MDHISGPGSFRVERLYAAGYTLTTLGVGDIVPTTALGRVLIVVCSASGLLTLTLAITYLVPVLNAVTARRVLAATLNALGGDPEQVRQRLWPGGDLKGTRATVEGLASDIRFVTQAHYSYPVMHFFHWPTPATAFAPAFARLALAVETHLNASTAPRPHRTCICICSRVPSRSTSPCRSSRS